ncbi:hypothetical protein T265_14123 [Opisthorchis viverrini]|uniref:C2H2-type domain-containing protein n=1 Tax=Opisthorchis viverrini TaxID=6198 RepID=A0A074ZF86_OPIVI|nr:hypothetical protein T265_14123 [Opisthorchis viverrini]KER25848.1 hypothetical protein T265_14123 [Opisthorchis viverrini]
MHSTPLPLEDYPYSTNAPVAVPGTPGNTRLKSGSDAVLSDWTYTLEYGSLPTVQFAYLPLRIQHLIGQRVSKSRCPLFTLVVSNRNHWCLVKLSGDPSCESPMKIKPRGTDLDAHTKDTILPPMACRLKQATLILTVDEHTEAHYVGTSVTFHLTPSESTSAWKCPFCGSSFFLGTDINGRATVEQHLRLHLELRCCMDCATLLPNTTRNVSSSSPFTHECSTINSQSIVRTDCLSSALTHAHLSDGQTSVPNPSPVFSNPINLRKLQSCDSEQITVSLPEQRGTLVFLCPNSKPSKTCHPSRRKRVPETYCVHCNMELETPGKYQQHRKNVHRPYRLMCPECGVSFSTKGNLTKHFLSLHNQATSSQCALCKKQFLNRYNLQRHIQQAHPKKMPTPQFGTSPTASASVVNPFSEIDHVVPKPDVSTVDHLNEGSALRCLPTASDVLKSRGFYLYLSEAGTTRSAPDTPHLELCTDNTNSTNHPSQSALVAEVHLTPCEPSTPDAQYGLLESAWRQSIRLPNNFSGPTL